jgi:hypothetical protein
MGRLISGRRSDALPSFDRSNIQNYPQQQFYMLTSGLSKINLKSKVLHGNRKGTFSLNLPDIYNKNATLGQNWVTRVLQQNLSKKIILQQTVITILEKVML